MLQEKKLQNLKEILTASSVHDTFLTLMNNKRFSKMNKTRFECHRLFQDYL